MDAEVNAEVCAEANAEVVQCSMFVESSVQENVALQPSSNNVPQHGITSQNFAELRQTLHN